MRNGLLLQIMCLFMMFGGHQAFSKKVCDRYHLTKMRVFSTKANIFYLPYILNTQLAKNFCTKACKRAGKKLKGTLKFNGKFFKGPVGSSGFAKAGCHCTGSVTVCKWLTEDQCNKEAHCRRLHPKSQVYITDEEDSALAWDEVAGPMLFMAIAP